MKPTRHIHQSLFFSVVAVVVLVNCGCDVFSPRTPAEPNTGSGSFQPPTSSSSVIANFKSMLEEKNVENFIDCLADSSTCGFEYSYSPTPTAQVRFTSLWSLWTRANERQALASIISKMEQTGVVELTLMNGKFDATYPDSAIYVADYDLKIPHQVVSVATRARGTFRLTIVIGNNALWYIRSWQDQQSIEDSTSSSWSELKAQFSN